MIVALLRSSIVRIVAVGMMLLALQNTIFADMRPAGVILQVMLAFAAAAGAAGGSERGATAGFILGLMYDLGTGAPLGSSSITMGLAGYIAGYMALDQHRAPVVAGGDLRRRRGRRRRARRPGGAGASSATPTCTAIGSTPSCRSSAFAAAVASPLLVPVSRWCLRLGTTGVEGAGRMSDDVSARASGAAGLPDWVPWLLTNARRGSASWPSSA